MENKIRSSIFEEALLKQHQQESHHRFTLEMGLLIAFVFGFYMLGVNNPNYNTLFLDEAINAVVGEDLLEGVLTRNALTFHFGSSLYPLLSATLDRIGGITALRLMSTLMMCLASVFIYLSTRKLFGSTAGLISQMLFLFSGTILNLGQLAVYDSLAIPFLAASLYFLIAAATSENRQNILLVAASGCIILSTLSKYIGLIYIPALFITAWVLLRLKGLRARQVLAAVSYYILIPILLVWAFYGALYRDELMEVLQGQRFPPASQGLILQILARDLGLILFLAVAGLMILAAGKNQVGTSFSLQWSESMPLSWKALSASKRVLVFFLLMVIFCTWLAAPLWQLFSSNGHSLWKHCAYSLIFLSPLAGFCLASVVDSFRSLGLFWRLGGATLFCLAAVYVVDSALNQNSSFQQSWPNTQDEMAYLREAGLDENSRVLAEGMDIYEYYFDFGTNDRQVWNNFWFMEYGGRFGQEAMSAAIQDRAFDFVIIDDYYLPGTRERVEPVLIAAGYVVGWQQEQKLHSGETIVLQVFIPEDEGSK